MAAEKAAEESTEEPAEEESSEEESEEGGLSTFEVEACLGAASTHVVVDIFR